jgi:hypothetical protein
MSRPRKTGGAVVHQIKLVLVPGQDDDLIELLRDVPSRKKAAKVKAAIRSGGNLGGPAEDDDELAGMLDQFLL